MPRKTSTQIKNEMMILNWPGNKWNSLKESTKVKIWCALIAKRLPTKLEGPGEDGEFVVNVKIDGDKTPQEPGNRISEYITV